MILIEGGAQGAGNEREGLSGAGNEREGLRGTGNEREGLRGTGNEGGAVRAYPLLVVSFLYRWGWHRSNTQTKYIPFVSIK